MEYKIITDEDGFLAEKESWSRLCDQMQDATPFQTWEWNYYWWKYNESADSLFLIKAFEGKQVFGYAPLVVKDKIVEFIGGRDMDYGSFLVRYRRVGVIEGFLQQLQERGYWLALQEIPARSPQLHILQRLLENQKKYILHRTTRTAFVDLRQYDNFEAYMRLLSQSMRNKTIKVALKKNLQIQKEPVTEQLLAEIDEIYKNRQDARGGTQEIAWAFPIIKNLQAEGLLNVFTARKEQEAIGFLVAMQYKKRQYIWLVAFKQEYKDSFPGQLLFYGVLKDGFESGDDMVDFMRGDYDFKLRWECALDTNYTIYVCRNYRAYWKKKTFFAIKPIAKRVVYSSPMLERIYRSRGK